MTKVAHTALRITTPGAVLDGLEIWGAIEVAAPNVTIKNCTIHPTYVTKEEN